MTSTEVICKVSLAGESMVGKTSLIRRFVTDQFDDKYLMTLGTKVSKKNIAFSNTPIGKVEMTMMVWDIIGLQGYHSKLHKAHFQGAKGALLVYDVTREETLESLRSWAEEILNVSGEIPLIFLANKSDLKPDINKEDIENLAEKYNTKFFLTSAKTGLNVQNAFEALGEAIVSKMR